MILDFLRQKLANSLGGWQSATHCHFNVAVYKAKCQVIDQIPLKELAKAKFEEGETISKAEDTVKLSDIVGGLNESAEQGSNQTKSMV